MEKKKKRSVTLIEIMIVIMLIGLIGGALAFNMRGSMDQGRVFKTEQNQARIQDILTLEIAKGEDPAKIKSTWETKVKESPLANQDIVFDGWKDKFEVSVDGEGEVVVVSKKLNTYNKKKNA
ncbi:MAG: hypothetical protein S4CHLAM45_11330 [Chlamydiales bacterium]|nr:hypothetical protein [Chlamydiales bacterium]MCH9619625.1 hypothetical protein [Chlamydiales bacterium]MCH9623231.1 hypothetical protein [Chlamydiales bacterium]